ncbi:helix-turn-helix domain-containing protein [Nocardia carnea]|uniref:helix-turn-helix domain-containing protein n=1 Tax=Nocardia carnea TaxID=37328 RepID=UPI0024565F22|nr:helix-turn-helix domain-containing protein [Nocardia carnea]
MEPTSQVVTAHPAPALAAFIDGYIGYRMTGFAAGLHRGLPSRHMTFIVAIGPAIDVISQTDTRQSPDNYRCVLGGLQDTPAMIAHDGTQEGVAVKLTPMGCRALFGLPAAELWSTSIEFADLIGAPGRQLWEELQEHAGWPQRFAACDRVLTRLLIPERTVGPELSWAWRTVARSHGTVGVEPLAERIGWSRQYLTKRFSNEFGLSPKVAGRIARFERAKQMLVNTPSFVSIAQVAAACGYYDQPHLNREFARLAGCSPTQWLAEEIPSVQDPELAGEPG